jgi:hypothetical protein
MKANSFFTGFILLLFSVNCMAQNADGGKHKKNSDPSSKATQFVEALNLDDTAKASKVTELIKTHLDAVMDWHNTHDYTLVPEGLNPTTGKTFSKLDRQFIIDSTIPKTVHETLMAGLHQYLTDEQVELILDKYTIGKVAFTMNGYKSIVTNITPVEEAFVLTNLKLAREQAIDYKNMDEISLVFKIYKTKIEDYFTNNGRNWKAMFKAYADQQIAKKKAGDKTPADTDKE